ncbi:VOC family protein [Acidisoma silvae]|uniref:VOC family protein n=1 Tax=Acidisoma silvae TaxID=2802396 RepID=A0A963YR91_9PROT|nr:VOC family protein [Acidisoma silvae]MCB8875018.1 VOC family protein [Acidisoma silvae]
MDQVLALRPFVPAKDFALSKRFYQALGFRLTWEEPPVAMLKMGSFSFILQDFHEPALAENFMVQLLVRDVESFWDELDINALMIDFAVKPPQAPAIQPWGMKVGFITDPSGVLWHVAETPF